MTCNTYEELGLPDPVEMLNKARLVRQLEFAVDEQRLRIPVAASRLGMTPERLDAILGGRFRAETPEFLVRCLRMLGHEVHVTIKPLDPQRRNPGEFHLIPPVIVQ